MVFERAGDEARAARHERRGERVAGKPGLLHAIETKTERFGAVDQATLREPVRLGIRGRGAHRLASDLVNATDEMTWVRVSRTTVSQLRQPQR